MSSVRRLQKEGYLYGSPSAALNLDPNKGRDGRTFPAPPPPKKYAFSERKKAKKIRSVFQQNKANLLKKIFILFEFGLLKKHTFWEAAAPERYARPCLY